MEVTYNNRGRMNYNQEFHTKQGLPWDNEDLQYLIEYFDIIGPEEMSLALERTEPSILTKVTELRNKKIMPIPNKKIRHRRMRKEKN